MIEFIIILTLLCLLIATDDPSEIEPRKRESTEDV